MAKQFVHVLIAATYSSNLPIPSKILADGVTDRLIRTEELHTITAYSMAYPIRPTDCGLKDVWDKMDDGEREMFSDNYPQLATAIALMCGGDDGEEQARNQKDGNRIDPTQS
jgi:hypothetical protein